LADFSSSLESVIFFKVSVYPQSLFKGQGTEAIRMRYSKFWPTAGARGGGQK